LGIEEEMKPRTMAGFIHALLGGILILVSGYLWLSNPPSSYLIWPRFTLPFDLLASTRTLALIGIACGILVIGSAVLMLMRNANLRKVGYLLALIFSVISIVMGGGWGIGLILGLIGSILGLSAKYSLENVKRVIPHFLRQRAWVGFMHALIGGILIFINGQYWGIDSSIAKFIWSGAYQSTWWSSTGHIPLSYWGMACGVLTIVSTILVLIRKDSTRQTGAVMAFLFALLGLVSSGGWMMGSILGLIGGALGALNK
jgi:hypothetical protein